jgi:hypothetical protein
MLHYPRPSIILGRQVSRTDAAIYQPDPVKLLAYADDVCVFLSNSNDFDILQRHLTNYNRVFNSKINMDKTEALFLSGQWNTAWGFSRYLND